MEDTLTDLLISQRKRVLFIGEGNFTFTVAFAALREYHQGEITWEELARPVLKRRGLTGKELAERVWGGITSTRYEPVGPPSQHQFVGEEYVQCKPAPVLSEVKLKCVESCVQHQPPAKVSSVVALINQLPNPPPQKLPKKYCRHHVHSEN